MVFDDIFADMISNKIFNPIVTELFIKGGKLNISIGLITQSHFAVPKDVMQNASLSSGKIDKYEYLTGEEILSFNQIHMTKQAKFPYYPLGKAFQKQTKTIEDQGEKQRKAVESLNLSNKVNNFKQVED